MKVDARIEGNCRRTISYLQGYSCLKLQCKKLSNQKHTANTVRNTRRTTSCWMRGKIRNFYLSNLLCLSLSFRNLSQQGKLNYLQKTLKRFKRRRIPFWGELKPAASVLLTVHFSAAPKALAFGNLLKVFRLDITFARDVCHLGIKMKKIWQSSYSFHYPQWQNARANVMANLIQGFSLQLKMDRLKYGSWWPYFSSRREPSGLKTGRRFPQMLYRASLRLLCEKRRRNTQWLW